ncbi:MAG: hypothetical protein EBZ48_09310, partial [Proteobacteria bacterium]|nr:hypothetical protein [Pseudomonadota bacterium]
GEALGTFNSQVLMRVNDTDPTPDGVANRVVSFFSPYGRAVCTQLQFLSSLNNRLLCPKGLVAGIALLDPLHNRAQEAQWAGMWDLSWFPTAAAVDPQGNRVFVAEEATLEGTGSFSPSGLLRIWDYAKLGQSVAWRADNPPGTFMSAANTYAPQRIADFNPGQAGEQRLNYPNGLLYDSTSRTLYVLEVLSHQIRRFIVSAAAPTTIVQELSPIGQGQLQCPMGLTRAVDGNLLIADTCNHRVVKMSTDGAVLRIIGGPGRGSGQLYYPYNVAEDPRNGTLYVSDTGNQRVVSFSADGAARSSFNTMTLPDGTTRTFSAIGALTISTEGVLAVQVNTVELLLLLLR